MTAPDKPHRNPLAALTSLEPGEGRKAAWSAAFFFFVLFGYFLIKPVREALGVERGMSEMRWLFVGTLAVMFIANPIYAWVVGRWDRRKSLPVVYHFFVTNLLAFAALLAWFPDVVGVATGRTFFIWLSVFNLFCVTMFWTLMADGFSLAQAKRLFPVVAVGGTVGGLTGSKAAQQLVDDIGHVGLIVAAAVCIEIAVVACWRLTRCFDREAAVLASVRATGRLPADVRCAGCGAGLGGIAPDESCTGCGAEVDRMLATYSETRSERAPDVASTGVLEGLRAVLRSPYLAAVCGYILMMTIASTFLYFAQARIVSAMTEDMEERTQAFANINMLVQLTTLVVQLGLTGRLIRRFGVGRTLAVLPIIAAAGFIGLGVGDWMGMGPERAFVVLAVLMAVYSAAKYAIARPARETLFTVVPRDEKYKAKSFIDTFVYRSGDVVGAGADAGLAGLVGVFPTVFTSVFAGLALTIAPFAVVWAGLGLFLGTRQKQLAGQDAPPADPNVSTQPTGASP